MKNSEAMCMEENCDSKALKRGLCQPHYTYMGDALRAGEIPRFKGERLDAWAIRIKEAKGAHREVFMDVEKGSELL